MNGQQATNPNGQLY